MNAKQFKSIILILLGSIFLIGLILWNTKLEITQIEAPETQRISQEIVDTAPLSTAWSEAINSSSSNTSSLSR